MMQFCHLSIFLLMCVKKNTVRSCASLSLSTKSFFFQVRQYIMNPKAMPRQQLLGQIDMDTREWTDGVLTNSARNVVRESQGNKFYISTRKRNRQSLKLQHSCFV